MIDPAAAAVRGLAMGDRWTPALAFVAGAASSFSPCVAPRLLTVAALSANKSASRIVAVAAVFIAGVVSAYSALAFGGSVVWQLLKYSGWFYIVLATSMALAGVFVLAQHPDRECAHAGRSGQAASSVFLLGASSVVTLSPCCLPVVTAATLYANTAGPAFAWLTVTCFALGHAMPLAFAATGAGAVGLLASAGVQAASRVVAGSLMLAVAGLYFILA